MLLLLPPCASGSVFFLLLPVAYVLWLFASMSISCLRHSIALLLPTNSIRRTLLCRLLVLSFLLLLPLLTACVSPPCACVPVLAYYRLSALSRLACSMRRALLLSLLLLPVA